MFKQANKKSSEAKVCYTKFIKKKKAAYDTEYGEYGAWEGNYKIVDINGDKIPELLVVGLNGKSYIYTYKTPEKQNEKIEKSRIASNGLIKTTPLLFSPKA